MKNLDLFSGIYKGKKILVTGDTGFKGSWMCIWLKELGADVYGYALAPLTKKDNYVTTELSTKIHHVDGDVRNLEQLQKLNWKQILLKIKARLMPIRALFT